MREETMADTTVATPTEATLDAETFDMEGWLAGLQPVRRAVVVYPNGALQAELDVLAEAEKGARGERLDEIRAQIEQVVEAMQASAMRYTIQGWSSARVKAFYASLDEAEITDTSDRVLAQLAEQIVSPRVTVDFLTQMMDGGAEASVVQMLHLMNDANSRPVTIPARFLRGASA